MRARGRPTGAATTRPTRSCAPSSSRQRARTTATEGPVLEAFEVLFEAEDLPSYLLPFDLERIYGGIGFAEEVVYSNFVTSIDGVAALGDGRSAGSVISAKNPGDRFVMALLRACADAVLIGGGTLGATPGHHWNAAHVAPQFAESFAALRRSLGRTADPRLVVMTAHGRIDRSHPAVKGGATIVTSEVGAAKLGTLPEGCEVIVAGSGDDVDITRALDELRGRGLRVVLTEGGPTVMGLLLRASALDEMFLTVSPVLAGRGEAEKRLGMVEGVELLPNAGLWSRLLSARRHGDFLFLRYGLRPSAA